MRPAKHVERLMVVEACRRLVAIAPLDRYEYVGFGGLEFVDFELFHRELGIHTMTSIEQDSAWAERYEFNKPFRGVEMRFGRASEVLPSLNLNGLRIVWLDYEQNLDVEVLRDAESVARRLHAGSLLIVTVNAKYSYSDRVETLVEKVGRDRVPLEIDEEALRGKWGVASAQRGILVSALENVIRARGDGAGLQQLFNFHYADGAPMQTLGWLTTSAALDQTVANCHFEQLSFVRTDEAAVELRVPILTRREVQRLDQLLPTAGKTKLKEKWLDLREQEHFAEIYRYYPAFL